MAGMYQSGMFGATPGGGFAAGFAAGFTAGFAAGQAVLDPGPDLSSDQYFLHGLETVELDDVDVLNVYRMPEHEVEQEPTEGVYLSRNVEFQFPVGDALYPAGRRPFVGSAVVDGDGNTYVITEVRHPFENDFWGCQARASVIADTFDADDTVSLFRPGYTKDPALGKIATLTADVAFANVAAKIMLRESVSEQYGGQDQFVESYDIYIDTDIGQVNNGDILKDQDEKQYKIVSYRNRLHFNEFSVMECELRQVGP